MVGCHGENCWQPNRNFWIITSNTTDANHVKILNKSWGHTSTRILCLSSPIDTSVLGTYRSEIENKPTTTKTPITHFPLDCFRVIQMILTACVLGIITAIQSETGETERPSKWYNYGVFQSHSITCAILTFYDRHGIEHGIQSTVGAMISPITNRPPAICW